MTRRAWLCALAAVVLSACGNTVTGTAADFRYVNATNSCAPADGPAVSIYLSAKPFTGSQVDQPYVAFNIWTGLRELSGRPYRLAQNSNDGFGSYYADQDRRAGLVTGTVLITRVAPDSSVHGTVDVQLTDGTRFVRDFVAPWRPTRTFCG
jgi:hypothetical protein